MPVVEPPQGRRGAVLSEGCASVLDSAQGPALVGAPRREAPPLGEVHRSIPIAMKCVGNGIGFRYRYRRSRSDLSGCVSIPIAIPIAIPMDRVGIGIGFRYRYRRSRSDLSGRVSIPIAIPIAIPMKCVGIGIGFRYRYRPSRSDVSGGERPQRETGEKWG